MLRLHLECIFFISKIYRGLSIRILVIGHMMSMIKIFQSGAYWKDVLLELNVD